MTTHGLYDHTTHHDSCGFGLIAHKHGQASHHLVQTAITALARMTHRGAIAADGKTGDGCGLLLQFPKPFFDECAKSFCKTPPKQLAVGVVFTSTDADISAKTKQHIEAALAQHGLKTLGWRAVPTDSSVCGEIALSVLPDIHHVFVTPKKPLDEEDFELKLFLARKQAEQYKEDEALYIPSMSSRVIIYKGLVMPEMLPKFYLDLQEPTLESAICVFHQRFSTNTLPEWRLAQPFRMLAHNGEINTIWGNRNWVKARTPRFASPKFPDIESISPIVDRKGSDSASLDNMLETLVQGGMSIFKALRILIPPAWQNVQTMDSNLRAFFDYHSNRMEPWDGPAGLVMTDGRYALCALDRNGLRPARYMVTDDDYVTIASEIGVYDAPAKSIIEKGRLGPGDIVAIDTQTGTFLRTDAINDELKKEYPYKQWLKEHTTRIFSRLIGSTNTVPGIPPSEYTNYFKMFQLSFEERDQILRPLGETANEPIGSMGDDTPMAVLSTKTRSLYDYFRQQFAQVTNPPIDPLREKIVMSLETCFGGEPNLFTSEPENAHRIVVDSPVLSLGKFTQLMTQTDEAFLVEVIDLHYQQTDSLKSAITRVCQQAENAVHQGKTLLVLSDRQIQQGFLPIHAALATGAVHHHLVKQGLRCDANIIVETATARNAHHFAVLVGFGATAVHPYLAFEVFRDLKRTGELTVDPADAIKNYRQGIEKALLKILSKMGIATISSYRGAQLFEAIGLSQEVVDLCFKGVPSRIQGATFEDLQADSVKLAKDAWMPQKQIETGGLLKYMHNSEYHSFNPDVVTQLISAAKLGGEARYTEFSETVNTRPKVMLRDLLELNLAKSPLPADKVEPAAKILPRFDTAGMSLGALSPEAHESLALAMATLGGRSNSGEGGEDPQRFKDARNSKIKQVASGRFGVTAEYLMSAEVIQIKIAQGAKPGEGGQLPGHKVTPLIARLRFSVPGVTLISPPPHHDIYSIEDLAQLIFDLKQLNPNALVSVKLVSEPGVGTIAVGVAKAYADLITISGYDGGTAASPLSSIKYAGSPWELGLAETHQALVKNGLRHKIRLQTDGGLKTGLDVIKAAILGAESFGFGTAPMVALGCKYLRICHLNNCATGVATQNDGLRKEHFSGLPQHVINYFSGIADEVRSWLAKLGVEKLEDIIGQTQYLTLIEGETARQKHLDLTSLLTKMDNPNTAHYCTVEQNPPFDKAKLTDKIMSEISLAIKEQTGGIFHFDINNYDRSIGARVSGEIATRYGDHGLAKSIHLYFKGYAGQSFGAWNVSGLQLHLEGDANDYVGKGMTGGKIIIVTPKDSQFKSNQTPIMGNTCLYGATGGKLFATGRAGERCAIRNSGAHVVVEGMGDHGCEYMTGGVVTSLGAVGHNFGAGMTGGFAYILDTENQFVDHYNHELIDIHRINIVDTGAHRAYLRSIIEEYVNETHSEWGSTLLDEFEDYLRHFWLVKPKAATFDSLLTHLRLQSA